jgi:hypothetical protein
MKIRLLFAPLLCWVLLLSCKKSQPIDISKNPFDIDWRFVLKGKPGAEQPGFDDSNAIVKSTNKKGAITITARKRLSAVCNDNAECRIITIQLITSGNGKQIEYKF